MIGQLLSTATKEELEVIKEGAEAILNAHEAEDIELIAEIHKLNQRLLYLQCEQSRRDAIKRRLQVEVELCTRASALLEQESTNGQP